MGTVHWKSIIKYCSLVALAGCAGALCAGFSDPGSWVRNGLFTAGIVAVLPFLRRDRPYFCVFLIGCAGALPGAITACVQYHLALQPMYGPMIMPRYSVPAIFFLGGVTALLHDLWRRRRWSVFFLLPGMTLGGTAAFCIRNIPYFPVMEWNVFRIIMAGIFASLPLALVLSSASILSSTEKRTAKRRTAGSISALALLTGILWFGFFFLSADYFASCNYFYLEHFRRDRQLAESLHGYLLWNGRVQFHLTPERGSSSNALTFRQDSPGKELPAGYFVADGFIHYRDPGSGRVEKFCRGTAVFPHPDGGFLYFRHERFYHYRDGVSQLFYVPQPLLPDTVRGIALAPDGKRLFFLVKCVFSLEPRLNLVVADLPTGEEYLSASPLLYGHSGSGTLRYDPEKAFFPTETQHEETCK